MLNNAIPTLSKDDEHGRGKDRIILFGPPGCGKTHASHHHWIFPAIQQYLNDNIEIYGAADLTDFRCCSFTRKGASTLKERAAGKLNVPESTLDLAFGTIHSFSLRDLSKGNRDRIQIYDANSKKILKRNEAPASRIPLSEESGSTTRAIAVKAWDYIRHTDNRNNEEFITRHLRDVASEAYGEYVTEASLRAEIRAIEKEKAELDAIDFTDMLELAVEVEAPPLSLLLVDECQDTTPLQWKLVHKWATNADCVVLVGDPDQTIYGFAGVTPELFTDHIGEYTPRRLSQSHRLPASVHRIATRYIDLNTNRRQIEYHCRDEEGEVRFASQDEIIQKIEQLAEGNIGKAMTVLSRSSDDLTRYEIELKHRAVPFLNNSGESYFNESKQLNIARSLIRLRTGKSIPSLYARLLTKYLPRHLLEASPDRVLEGIKGEAEIHVSVSDLQVAGFKIDAMYELGDIATLVRALRRFDSERLDAYSNAIKKYGIRALLDTPKITLSTIHADKGGQADIVALSLKQPYPVVVAEGELDLHSIEAERRVMYVGLTRSKHTLLIEEAGPYQYDEIVRIIEQEAYSKA